MPQTNDTRKHTDKFWVKEMADKWSELIKDNTNPDGYFDWLGFTWDMRKCLIAEKQRSYEAGKESERERMQFSIKEMDMLKNLMGFVLYTTESGELKDDAVYFTNKIEALKKGHHDE